MKPKLHLILAIALAIGFLYFSAWVIIGRGLSGGWWVPPTMLLSGICCCANVAWAVERMVWTHD